MKTYTAEPESIDVKHVGNVYVRTEDGHSTVLPLRLDLANHSPTGFAWNYLGSGPAQLALAILADLIDGQLAVHLHQAFKAEVIARMPGGKWELKEDWIREWIETKRIEEMDTRIDDVTEEANKNMLKRT